MLQAPRIVRWTLPALLLLLAVGGALIVFEGTRSEHVARDERGQATGRTHEPARRVTVRSGDTPTAIARRVDLTVVALLRLNPDIDPRSLRAGQILKIRP